MKKKLISAKVMYNEIQNGTINYPEYFKKYGILATLNAGIEMIYNMDVHEQTEKKLIFDMLKAIRPRNKETETELKWFLNLCKENKIKYKAEWEYGEALVGIADAKYLCDLEDGEDPVELVGEKWLQFNDINGKYMYLS